MCKSLQMYVWKCVQCWMWCATCVAVVYEYRGHWNITVQLLLPPSLCSNVSPIKTSSVWWCSITTDSSANMNFLSKTLLEHCLHLLPVLCAVLYYMGRVEYTVMFSVICSLLQGLVHEQLHVVNGNSLCIVCSGSLRVANHTLVQRVVNSTHIQIRLPVFCSHLF